MTNSGEAPSNSVPLGTIQDMISTERDQYTQYQQLCSHFQVEADPKATAYYLGKHKALRTLLDGMIPNRSVLKNLS